ncbi:hypothetical protein Pan189_33870 [Stratiformator vulcanicus]|uniref:Uncharacterized protein n=1 Tax=Stratiformator vulcanicus TaxID=2527980 RepID=A0A517R522_9PLAN|nr:hypothetical protein Pan189_33870 [Stratiformator vulcanicus]
MSQSTIDAAVALFRAHAAMNEARECPEYSGQPREGPRLWSPGHNEPGAPKASGFFVDGNRREESRDRSQKIGENGPGLHDRYQPSLLATCS